MAAGAVVGTCCADASALASRGHVFSSSFGESGSGEGQFSGPSAVAVDEASGLVYVSDTANDRVEVFRRAGDGTFAYVSQFAVRDPGPIAVDNSSSASDPSPGEVYVAGAGGREEQEEGERDTLYVFSPTAGEVTHKIHAFKFKAPDGEELEEEFEESISGVSVDANGTLWVYWEEEGVIDAFAKEAGAHGPKLQWQPALRRDMEERFECPARSAFAVAPDDSAFYTGYERRNDAELCPGEEEGATPDPTVVAKLSGVAPTPETLIAEIDHHDTTGVAVDSGDGDVYLDGRTSVDAYTSAGVPIQRFGEGDLTSGSGVAVDTGTGEVLVADASADRVVVFGAEDTAAKPVVDSVSSENVTPRSAELQAQIDPQGLQTSYRFEWGTRDCREAGSGCASSTAQTIPAGWGDVSVSVRVEGLQPASVYYVRVIAANEDGESEGVPSPSTFSTLPSPGVLPDGRGWELVSPADMHGASVASDSPLQGGLSEASLDGSRLVWLAAGPAVGEPQGNRAFELSQLISVRSANGWQTTSLETPHTNGWGLLVPSPSEYRYFTPDLSEALVAPTEYDEGKTEGVVEHPALSPEANEKTIYRRPNLPEEHPNYTPLVTSANDTANSRFGGALDFAGASEDLSHVLFHSDVGLTAEHPSSAGLYVWQQDRPLELVSVLPNGEPAADGEFGEPSLGAYEGRSARGAIGQDGNLVYWTNADGTGLYLRDVALGETIRVNAAQGQEATEPGPGGQTLSEPPEEEHPTREVRFQAASQNGRRVFFTDTARLAEESNQEPDGSESPADLYELKLTSLDPLHARLSDISAGAPSASADVLNVIPGSSQDGSVVYFVANGVLAPGATPGRCARDLEESEPSPPGATCNLYVSEETPGAGRQVRFIAALSAQDGADWGASPTSQLSPQQLNLATVSSSVSPNGRYLAFMSQQPLTGYDNTDATSGEPDEEVYLYDAATDRLTCTSCNPGENSETGGWVRPHGVFDTEHSGEGVGLLADRPEVWNERWLAASIPGWTYNINGSSFPETDYQPRYLSDSGRLFFDSPDALVPQDTNGKQDVYEYEPQGVGTCQDSGGCTGLISSGTSERESAFLDASENGDDVFFITAAPLVAADKDQSFDIYDAHVCTTESPCLQYPNGSTSNCEASSQCRPGSVQAPGTATPPTVTTTGAANSGPGAKETVSATKKTSKPAVRKLTRAQQLTKALHSCRTRHRHSKSTRHRCERQARSRYASRKHKTKKRKKASSGKVRGSAHTARPVESRR